MSALEEGKIAFAYQAQSIDGTALNGTLEGRTAEEVQAKLAAIQLRVLKVVPAQEEPRRGRRLGEDDFLIFNQQLAHLTRAGLPVETGLRLIADDIRSGRLARAAQDVAGELERGVPLKEAFSRHANRFPALYGRLLEAGANLGNLPAMLFGLGRHLALVGRLREMLWRTISYPLMVLAGVSLVLLFVAKILMPRMEELYHSMAEIQIPWLTQALLAVSHVYPAVFFGVWSAIAALVLYQGMSKLAGMRGIAWEALWMRTPVVGGILKANLMARWIDALRLGVEAGLDLPRAIGLAAQATGGGGRALRMEAARLSELITQGQPVGTFQGKLIPATVPAALEMAAHGGDLPVALATLAEMYEQQAEYRLRLLPSFLTPLLMVVIGGGIGLCIAALFLPLMEALRWIEDPMFGT